MKAKKSKTILKFKIVMVTVALFVSMMPSVAFADEIHAPTTGDYVAQTPEKTEVPAVFVVQGTGATKAIKYKWNKVDGASKYKVYQATTSQKKYTVIANTTATSYTKKKLKKGTAYKAYVEAYDADDNLLVKSVVIYTITKSGKYSNAKKVSATKSVEVIAGKTAKITAKVASKDSKKKVLNKVAAIRFYSDNADVATVSSKGVVTGVKDGICKIYSLAPNGIYAITEVAVSTAIDVAVDLNVTKLVIATSVQVPYDTWSNAVSGGWQYTMSMTGSELTALVKKAKKAGVSLGSLSKYESMLSMVDHAEAIVKIKSEAGGKVYFAVESCRINSFIDVPVTGNMYLYYNESTPVITSGQYNVIESGHQYILVK